MSLPWSERLLRVSPPWLRRVIAPRVLGGIGDVIGSHADRAIESVVQRFPKGSRPTALPYLGRDRRIRRGPVEPAATYAARLLTWWDDHRTRGGPHALLRQLHAYLLGFAPGQIDLVYQSGTRFLCAEADGAITRSDITWSGDGDHEGPRVLLAANATPGQLELRPIDTAGFPAEGRYRLILDDGAGGSEEVVGLGTVTGPDRILLEAPGVVGTYLAGPSTVRLALQRWARMWIVVHVSLVADELLTEGGGELDTEGGDELLGDLPPWGGAFDAADEAIWTAVPREWSAAHVQRITLVLRYGVGELWDYPTPVGTWDESSTILWDQDPPVVIVVED